jgi:protein SCO1/2
VRRIALSVAAVAATLALAVGFVVVRTHASAQPRLNGDITWAAGARAAPAVSLRDPSGRVLPLDSLRHRVVLLTFMDSHCTKECPVEGHQLAEVQRAFSPAARPDIVVVSVNPADTATSVHRFASLRGWRAPWYWLMGSHAQLRRVWRAYDITVEPTTNDILHSAALYIIDGSGHERSGFVAPFLPKLVIADVRTLEAEGA